jgi:type I restriction enzyme S subunit
MKKYQSYKPSGIDWLETIPKNWDKSKLKYLGNLYGGLTGKSGVDFNNDENQKNKPYIPYTNIFNNTYISKDHYHYVSVEEGENQNKVEKYDMFFLMSSETHKDLGKSCILIDDVDELYLNSFCKGYRIKNKNIQPLFLNYQILGHLHREMISVEGKGFTRINLRQDKINDLVVFYPPLQEQEQIVKYLDEKTSIIDKLISTKERKIELLKEQRTSLINEVITKGLNPNVKMKDTGVEWIGEIPESWERKKIKTISSIISKGTTPSTIGKEVSDVGEIRYLKSENIVENTISEYPQFFIDKETNELLKRSILIEGDILFVIAGASIGKTTILPKSFTPSNTNQAVSFIRLKQNENNKFVWYWLISSKIQEQMWIVAVQSAQPNLSMENLGNFFIPYPSIKEQQEIVEYLDKHTKEIDDLVSMEQKKIELLKEYRQSLISEVITGKIKVVE